MISEGWYHLVLQNLIPFLLTTTTITATATATSGDISALMSTRRRSSRRTERLPAGGRASLAVDPVANGRGTDTADPIDGTVGSRAAAAEMEPENGILSFVTFSSDNRALQLPVEMSRFRVTEREKNRFIALSEDERNACVRVVTRLILFKATRKEMLSRQKIIDALKVTNASYGSHASASLREAQKMIFETFGLHVTDGTQIPGADASGANAGKLYIVNTLTAPNLMRLLSESDDDADMAYKGFVFVALLAVFASSGRKIDRSSLAKRLKQVDRNIPDVEAVVSKKRERANDSDDGSPLYLW